MNEITRVAIDTSKSVFTLHGVDAQGRRCLRRNLRRSEVLAFFEKQPALEVVLEACGGSHYWGRALQEFGHRVRLIPAQYVKPFVKRGKNDRNDAEAICVAAGQPSIGSVPVKSAEDQARATLLTTRELLVRQRTQLVNALRGHASELGLVAPKGDKGLQQLQAEIATGEEARVPAAAKQALATLGREIARLEARGRDRRQGDRAAQGHPAQPAAGRDPRRRAGQRTEPGAARRSRPVQVRPPLRRLARPGAAAAFDRRQAAARRHQPRWRRAAAAVAGAGRHRGDPTRQARPAERLLVASGIAQAPPAQARGGGFGQQDGPHRVGHDDERGGLPATGAGRRLIRSSRRRCRGQGERC